MKAAISVVRFESTIAEKALSYPREMEVAMRPETKNSSLMRSNTRTFASTAKATVRTIPAIAGSVEPLQCSAKLPRESAS